MCAFLFDLAGQILKVPFPLAGVEGVVGGDNESILESETFWGRNQAEDLRFSLARRSAKATHSSTSFLSRL